MTCDALPCPIWLPAASSEAYKSTVDLLSYLSTPCDIQWPAASRVALVTHVSQLSQAPMLYQVFLAILTTTMWLTLGVWTPTCGDLPSVRYQHDGSALGLAAALSGFIHRVIHSSEQVFVSDSERDALGW